MTSRLSSVLSALDLRAKFLSDPAGAWSEIANIGTGDRAGEVIGAGPRVLRLFSRGAINTALPRGFEARLETGVGDVSYPMVIGTNVAGVSKVRVPSQGIALPIPAGAVRVSVRLPCVIADPPPAIDCQVFGAIAHGWPVKVQLPGGLECADPATPAAVTVDPLDFPFSTDLIVTPLATGAATVDTSCGTLNGVPVRVGQGTIRYPFNRPVTLANVANGALLYSIEMVM